MNLPIKPEWQLAVLNKANEFLPPDKQVAVKVYEPEINKRVPFLYKPVRESDPRAKDFYMQRSSYKENVVRFNCMCDGLEETLEIDLSGDLKFEIKPVDEVKLESMRQKALAEERLARRRFESCIKEGVKATRPHTEHPIWECKRIDPPPLKSATLKWFKHISYDLTRAPLEGDTFVSYYYDIKDIVSVWSEYPQGASLRAMLHKKILGAQVRPSIKTKPFCIVGSKFSNVFCVIQHPVIKLSLIHISEPTRPY